MLATGLGAMMLAAGWNVFDALVHVAVDLVEPPRITGNVAVLVTAGLVALLLRFTGNEQVAGVLTAGSIGVVVGANAAFLVGGTELAVPSLVFIGTSLWLQGTAVARSRPA